MKAASRSGLVSYHPCFWVAFALLFLPGCASTRVAEEEDPSDVEGVNIGYGTVDRDHLAGSVTTVQGEDVQVAQPRTLAEMLRRVPGVQVSEPSAGTMSVRIRGTGSFLGGKEPLYVLDGMVIHALGGINPNTIESITVLKIADATAIYGSRGANGVILIKTKRN